MRKRIDYIDTAKGIAILAVVLSHAITNSSNALETNHPILLNWLSFFNVSTFFFINGFLYNEKSVESPFIAILKKLKAYYIPYIIYNLFFLIFQNLLVEVHILDSSHSLTSLQSFVFALIEVLLGKIQPLTGPMWFLRSLIIISVLYILVDSLSTKIFGGKFRYIINGIVAIVILLLPYLGYTPYFFNIPAAFRSFIIYYLGVLYRKYDINALIIKHLYIIGLVSLVISIIIGNAIMVGIYGPINPPMDYLSMIVSIIFVISISQFKLISNLNVLKLFGKSSLEIMALHFLAFKPISYLFIKIYNIDISYLAHTPVIKLSMPDIWPVLYTISGMLLPFAFYVIKTKVKGRKHV